MENPNKTETPLVPGGIPQLEAEDLERVVDGIIRLLRAGKPARLPGLGTIDPGESWTFRQERGVRSRSGKPRHDR